MSIRIYDGLRAVGTNPFEVGLQARAILEPLFFEKISKLEQLVSSRVDEELKTVLSLSESVPKEMTPQHSVFTVVNRLNRSVARSFSPAAIGYELVLLPSAIDDRVLGLVFSEDKDYIKALKESGVFKDFGYWDNSDREDGVSKKKWKKRKASWGHLLGDKTPAAVGLTVSHPSSFAYSVWKIEQAELRRRTK